MFPCHGRAPRHSHSLSQLPRLKPHHHGSAGGHPAAWEAEMPLRSLPGWSGKTGSQSYD